MAPVFMPSIPKPTVTELRHALSSSRGRPEQYKHRSKTDYLLIARRFALSFLVLLIITALLTALYDIASQLIRSDRSSKVSDLIISTGMYVAAIISGAIIMLSRRFIVKSQYASIPKAYVPTQSTDVPKSAFTLISNEYDRAAVVTKISQPKNKVQQGWGAPGTPYEDIHFRTAILGTASVLETVITQLSLSPISSNKARSSSLSPLTPLIQSEKLPKALEPLAFLYEQQLKKARYGEKEPDEEDYALVVKYVAVFLDVLGKIGGVVVT